MRRAPAALLLFTLGTVTSDCGHDRAPRGHRAAPPRRARLTFVGPRLVSNQTDTPLQVYGERLEAGMRMRLGPPVSRDLPLVVVDDRHAFARLPGGLALPAAEARVRVALTLLGPRDRIEDGRSEIQIVNDTAFPDLTALASSRDGRRLFALSPTTDTIFVLDSESGEVTQVRTGDGPRALAGWVDGSGDEWIAVVHEFAPELRLYAANDPARAPRIVPAPSTASGLVVDAAHGWAIVAERARDTVSALDLGAAGRVVWRTPVLPNPREMAIAGDKLAVGSFETGAIELLSLETGASGGTVEPAPGTPIIGGHTADFSAYVMSGTAPRGLTWSARLGRLFMTSIGPNIGPNPQKMEVSMNSGVAVLDPAEPRYLRHLGFGAGVTEGMALDDQGSLLYVADIGVGLVRILDAAKLAHGDETAAHALLQDVPIPPRDGFPTARPVADYGVQRRAGVELHSGPRAVVLSPDWSTLWVLDRFTGTVASLDVRQARAGRATVTAQTSLVDTLGQRRRRLGEVLYFTDMGQSGMTCDACHPEGHVGGMLFEKTTPLRIYRSSSILGSLETPPYFIPASTHSLEETASFVGARNRFQNPALTPDEIEEVALYSGCIPTPPNPFVGPDGAPVERLELLDGASGNPRHGMALFETRGGCPSCHPAPLFTTDQDAASRGQYQTVGTPLLMPLRPTMQNRGAGTFPPPSLLGAWDMFPMFSTGMAGLAVTPLGTLHPTTRFPLRLAIESSSRHGNAKNLPPQDRNDLLAYLMSL